MVRACKAVLLWTAACAAGRGQTIDEVVVFREGAASPAEVPHEEEAALMRAPRLDLILRLARARSPDLAEARQRVAARAARVEVEGGLPPPRLRYEQWHVPLAEPWALGHAQMIMVGLEQELPAPGSRAARAEAARADAGEGAAEARARELDLVRQVKRAFVDYQEVRRELELHQEHLGLSREIIDATRSTYAAGRGNQQDVLMAELQATRLHAEIVALEQHERSVRALLNSLMRRAAGAPLGEPPPLATDAGAPADLTVLERLQDANRPEVAAAAQRRRRADAARLAAERESLWPAFMVGVDYMRAPEDDHPDGYGAMISMTLPWLGSRGRAVARAAREDARAEARGEAATRVTLRYELHEAAAHVDAARRTLQTIEHELLPQAERGWTAARIAFRTQGGAVALLGSLDAYLEVRLEHVRAQAQLQRSLADLDRAAGAPLEGSP